MSEDGHEQVGSQGISLASLAENSKRELYIDIADSWCEARTNPF